MKNIKKIIKIKIDLNSDLLKSLAPLGKRI